MIEITVTTVDETNKHKETLEEILEEMQKAMSDFQVYLQEQADIDADKWLNKRPVCAYCGEHIQEEYAHYINDEWICDDCMRDFERSVDDYVEGCEYDVH